MRAMKKIALVGFAAMLVLSLSLSATWASAQEENDSEITEEEMPSYNEEGYHFEYDRGQYHASLVRKVHGEQGANHINFALRARQGPSVSLDMGAYGNGAAMKLGVNGQFIGLVEFVDMNENGEFDPGIDEVVSHIPLSERMYHMGIIEKEEEENPDRMRMAFDKGYDIGYDIGMRIGMKAIEEGIPYTEDPMELVPEDVKLRIRKMIGEHFNEDDKASINKHPLVSSFLKGVRKGIYDGYNDAYEEEEHPDEYPGEREEDEEVTRSGKREREDRSKEEERSLERDQDGKDDDRSRERREKMRERIRERIRERMRERIRERMRDENKDEMKERARDWIKEHRLEPETYLKPIEVLSESFSDEGFRIAYQVEDLTGVFNAQIGLQAVYDDNGMAVPSGGGIRVHISGYPYESRDSQVALICAGGAHYSERYSPVADNTDTSAERPVDPHSLIDRIVPTFVDMDGEVMEPLWQSYHKKIVEEESLFGYHYSEYHVGAFSFTRDQVPYLEIEDEEEPAEDEVEPVDDEEEEEPADDEDEDPIREREDENLDDEMNILPEDGEDSNSDKGSVMSVSSGWFAAAAGIGVVLLIGALVAILGLTRNMKK